MRSTRAHMPAIYGVVSPEAERAYSKWIMALFARTEHVDACPFGCRDDLARCSDGEAAVAAEQQRWAAWHELRRQERG